MHLTVTIPLFNSWSEAWRTQFFDWIYSLGLPSHALIEEVLIEGAKVYVLGYSKAEDAIVMDDAYHPLMTIRSYDITIPPPAFLARYPLAVTWVVPYYSRHRQFHPHLPKEATFVMSEITVLDSQVPFTITVDFKNAEGQVVPPDDIPLWASSNETVARITSTTPDGTQGTCTIVGSTGQTRITVSSVNHAGTKIVLEGLITVNQGDAVTGDLIFPPDLNPQPEPAPAPAPASGPTAAAVDPEASEPAAEEATETPEQEAAEASASGTSPVPVPA